MIETDGDDADFTPPAGDPAPDAPSADELSAEQLKAHLEKLRPEDFGKFTP